MENATNALYMAGSMLLLIIALTVAISSFSSIKVQAEQMIAEDDATSLAKADGEYINYIKNADDVRTVGAETLISSIRRVEKENYRIYIVPKNNLKNELINNVGLKSSNGANQKYKDNDLINENKNDVIFEIAVGGENRNVSKFLNDKFYNVVKDKTFKEYLGIYQNNTDEGVSDVNKETYRIITYVQQ